MIRFYNIQKKVSDIEISEQRKRWFVEFMKPFLAVCMLYIVMYILRNNFKAAQPLLKEQLGYTTTELGYIGFAFSLAYGFGRLILGYFFDGKNTKKILSTLLILSSISVLMLGLFLTINNVHIGWIMLFWGLNAVFQSTGGPCAYSTITKWTPRTKRGRYMGLWNSSHNLGGALAGVIALWFANTFFGGSVIGMFIGPVCIGLVIGLIGLFFGKDSPEELGWKTGEEIFGEPVDIIDKEVETISKREMIFNYVLKNPWIWILCITNIFVYIIRIGVDNWCSLYAYEHLNFSNDVAVKTIFYYEMGALFGSMGWGYISDLFKGRRALIAIVSGAMAVGGILWYQNASTEISLYASLFILGLCIFGPHALVSISIAGFAPKSAVVFTVSMIGTFGYIFGDSMAKVFLAKIADPQGNGISIFGHVLHGWGDTFTVLYVSAAFMIALFLLVAFAEERKIRQREKQQ